MNGKSSSLEGRKIVKEDKGPEELVFKFDDGSILNCCLVDEIKAHGAHVLRMAAFLNGEEYWKDGGL